MRPAWLVLLASPALPLSAAEQGAAAATARLTESPLASANLFDTAVGLILVIVLILGLAWAARRFIGGQGLGKGPVRILGGVSLGARERAVLLAIGQTRLLVGVSPGSVRTLHVLPEAAEASEPEFALQLDQAQSRVAP